MWSAGCLLGYSTDLDGVRHGKIHAVQPYVFGRGTIQFREKECQLLCGPFRYGHEAFPDGVLLVDEIFLIQQKDLFFIRKPGQTHGELLRIFDGQNDAPGAIFQLFGLEHTRFGQGRKVLPGGDEPCAVRAGQHALGGEVVDHEGLGEFQVSAGLGNVGDLVEGQSKHALRAGGDCAVGAPVVLIGREAGSGTRDGFESITGTEDVCKYSQELTSTGAVITAVVSNPNAIGYASLSAVNDTVKTVLVNGVAPSEETVLSGDYQIQRPFVFVTKSDSALSESAQQFFDFALSTDASDIIADAGAVPLV